MKDSEFEVLLTEAEILRLAELAEMDLIETSGGVEATQISRNPLADKLRAALTPKTEDVIAALVLALGDSYTVHLEHDMRELLGRHGVDSHA